MHTHHRSLDDLHLDASAVTIGAFDGVHLGHQSIIRELIECARLHEIPSVVVTFFPHPFVVLTQLQDPFYLTFPDQRAEMLFELGVDHVITIPFTKTLSEYTSEAFMQWLYEHLQLQFLCIGEDFALGKGRKGNPETLSSIGSALGYQLKTVSPVLDEGEKVSSSRIRKLIRAGEIKKASAMLGRLFSVEGLVPEKSEKEGFDNASTALITFSTRPMQLLPAAGFYAARIWLEENAYLSIVETDQNETKDASDPASTNLQISIPDLNVFSPSGKNIKIDFLFQLDSADKNKTLQEKIDRIRQEISTVNEVSINGEQPKSLSA